MIVQGSPEWFASRLGKVTASRIADVVTRTKTGYGAGRANYAAELLIERLTGAATPSFINDAMRWGTETEPLARAAYELKMGATVYETSLVDHPEIAMSAASPDGLVGADGLIEIKCPNSATHLDTLLYDNVAQRYVLQMQWQMACTGRKWCDFVSFDPRLPPHLSLYINRLMRDETQIMALETEVVTFLAEIDQRIAELDARYRKEAA